MSLAKGIISKSFNVVGGFFAFCSDVLDSAFNYASHQFAGAQVAAQQMFQGIQPEPVRAAVPAQNGP